MGEIIPTRRDLERTIRRFAATGSGLDRSLVIPSEDNAPRPQTPYCAVNFVRDNRIGYPEEKITYRLSGEIDRVKSYQLREAKYDFNFYYDTIYGEIFANWIGSSPGVIEADRYRIRVKQYGDMIQMDEVVQDQWEERLVISCDIIYTSVYQETAAEYEASRIIVSHDKGTEVVQL